MNLPPPTPQPPRKGSFIGLLGIFLVAMGCLILVCVVGSGYLVLRFVLERTPASPVATPEISDTLPTPSRAVPIPTRPVATSLPTLIPSADLTGAVETLNTLRQSVVPNNDMRDLARRFLGKANIPETLPGPPVIYKNGDEQQFWIVNGDTDEHSQVKAKLAYTTDHLYFWIQTGVSYNSADLKKLCETFETKIYPTNREFFGSEWTPGIDNDVHLFVLLTGGLGSRVAGYFSSVDSVSPEAFQYSNGHEMFVMNTTTRANLTDPYNYTVLAHEFQHMIHWYRDRNEESWMNEGFSELAAFLNGYDVGGKDSVFASNPDLQLNDWPNDKDKTVAHYGSSFLFVDYYLDRFGPKATQSLVGDLKNGFDSVDEILSQLKSADPLTKQPITADDVFVDWTLTNYLKDKTVGDGRFIYNNYAKSPTVKDTETVQTCPVDSQARTVNQYGTDYIRIACRGKYTLSFKGSREVGVLPVGAHGGKYAFWSNKGDELDMTLTRSFDFTGLKDTINLTYWTWYDLEENYDFVYLVASTDDGKTWEVIRTPGSTQKNITGNNYGWGYNAKTNNWIQEKVDLSKYAGKKVILRFEYVTDAAVNGEGFLIDDMEISQLKYQANFETDLGGWEAAGFVRMQNRLPQTFRVSVVQGTKPRAVQYITINPDETFSLPIDLSSDALLVVSGTTRYTRLPANYTFSIQP